MAKNPYLDVIKQIVANAVGDRQATGQQADQQKTQAYTNYMTAQKNLATGLAQQGVTGGGSESALLGANVGYQNTLNTVNAQKGTSLNNIARDATANRLTAQTQSADWVANAQAVDEQRFANTITGYDTIAKVDNAIAAAKANGQGWKVNYLMAQRAALKEQAKYLASTKKATTKAATPKVVTPKASASKKKVATSNFDTGYSSGGIPLNSGGISGTQAGMTKVYYPGKRTPFQR